ncbi:MAG: hypothetical protein O2897_01010 [bacterium]|nr:hypothetical protein [bacterium]
MKNLVVFFILSQTLTVMAANNYSNSSNTCLPVLEDAVHEINKLNDNIAKSNSKVDDVINQTDFILQRVDKIIKQIEKVTDDTVPGIRSDVEKLTKVLSEIKDLVDERTNPAILLGWGSLSAAAFAVMGASGYWMANHAKTKWFHRRTAAEKAAAVLVSSSNAFNLEEGGDGGDGGEVGESVFLNMHTSEV